MRVRRRPPVYDAVQEGTNWVVTNLATKEKKIFTSKEFRLQFEPILDDKKPVTQKRVVDDIVIKPRYLHEVNEVTSEVTIMELFGPWEQK